MCPALRISRKRTRGRHGRPPLGHAECGQRELLKKNCRISSASPRATAANYVAPSFDARIPGRIAPVILPHHSSLLRARRAAISIALRASRKEQTRCGRPRCRSRTLVRTVLPVCLIKGPQCTQHAHAATRPAHGPAGIGPDTKSRRMQDTPRITFPPVSERSESSLSIQETSA